MREEFSPRRETHERSPTATPTDRMSGAAHGREAMVGVALAPPAVKGPW